MNVFKKTIARLSFLGSFKESGKDIVFIIVSCLLTVLVFIIPTGFEESGIQSNSVRCKARIVQVDNEYLTTIGPVRYGHQKLEIQVLSGRFKGKVFSTTNNLVGKMEMDKAFVEGENALVVLTLADDENVSMIRVMDHYRTDKTIILVVLYIILTIIIMGWMGLKILVTFVFSAVMLIKVLYPLALHGFDPIIGALIITTVISAVILFLVGGLSRRALTAFLGTASGIIFTAVLSFAFTYWFKIHGAVRPFAEMLLYSGYGHLNLAHLFIAGIFIAASGAMMDLSMDTAAAMDEIKKQQPAITRLQLMKSGYTVARQAAGTMSTTLLLAYSAEYTAMIMTFIAQGIPLENIINMVWVSSEIVHTLVGCFGLTLVAPLTVFAGGMLIKNHCA
ncbi:MAG: YibE/F family protein [Treponema sp.]|jgi:uncharacterized membrane protein|nr:YibE/F family protein [Treponema sp.]